MLGMWSGWAGYIRGEDDSLFRFLYSLFVIPLYVYFSVPPTFLFYSPCYSVGTA